MNGLDFLMSCNSFACELAQQATVELALARRIVNRAPADPFSADQPPRDGERLYAHTTVAGYGEGFLEHVWKRDGEEVARHYLPVGSRRRWRGWTCHRLDAGHYVIEVIAPDGRRIAAAQFDVQVRPALSVAV